MSLYDKFSRLACEREQFSMAGINPFGTCIDEVFSATEGRIGNQKLFWQVRITIWGSPLIHRRLPRGRPL